MNYQKIYDQIIDRAKKENRQKVKGGTYYETHHITPRCLGGLNQKENLVLLTAREHFVCHWVLCRIYPNNKKLAKAFNAMCILKKDYQQRYIPSSRTIAEARELNRLARIGLKISVEAIEKRTATRKEKGSYSRTKESVDKGIKTRRQRNSYKGKVFTAEHRDKLREKAEKQIHQFTLDGNLVATHKSLSSAANTLGINISGICRAATGRSKLYKGFIWKYA